MSVNARSTWVRSAATSSRTAYTLRCGARKHQPELFAVGHAESVRLQGSVTQRSGVFTTETRRTRRRRNEDNSGSPCLRGESSVSRGIQLLDSRGHTHDHNFAQGLPQTRRRCFGRARSRFVMRFRSTAYPLGLPLGLQLYSLRELLPKDFDGTLKAIAAAGYTEVEAAGLLRHECAGVQAVDGLPLACTASAGIIRWTCCSRTWRTC